MTANPETQSGATSPPPERPRTPESVRIASYTLRVICKECLETPANLVEDYSSGDTICGSCGLVLMEHQIDIRPEWRTFAGDDDNGPDPNRCGDAANALLDGNQLDTSIAFASRPSATAIGIARAQNKMHKDTANKTLLAAYADIGAYCESMRLTNMVTESAKEYYKKAYDSKVVRGRDNVTVIASCIFLACRWCGVPRTFNEVMSITKCAKKDISRTFRILSKFFRKEETEKIEAAAASGSVEPMVSNAPTSSGTALSVVPRICSHLQLGHKCEHIAEELVANVQRREFLGGRAPITIAATVVFFASHLCEDPKTFHQICEMTGIAPRTIKSAYKELYKRRIALVNPEWIVDGTSLLPIP